MCISIQKIYVFIYLFTDLFIYIYILNLIITSFFLFSFFNYIAFFHQICLRIDIEHAHCAASGMRKGIAGELQSFEKT